MAHVAAHNDIVFCFFPLMPIIRVCVTMTEISVCFDNIWSRVVFLTQASVLHKWKSTQLDIFILW